MSNAPLKSWNDNPNSPDIQTWVYYSEKANFAGKVTCAIFYGIALILFFRCMSILLDPDNRARGGGKWPLVVHTVTIFLIDTAYTIINLLILSVSYVDKREIQGSSLDSPGPFGYLHLTYSRPSGLVSTTAFLLNNLLVDGFLLYRCYVMYDTTPWVIVLPVLLYLATLGVGIELVYYQATHAICTVWRSSPINVGMPYSISVSLDVLLTLMIATRLVLISKDIRKVMGAPFRISAAYKAVISILGESLALYAITFLLWIGTWAANNYSQHFFFQILAQTQVIAPFLIIIQVSNQRSMTGDVVSGDTFTIPSSGEESANVNGTPSDGQSANLSGTGSKTPSELGVKVVTTIDLHHDKT